MLQRTTFGGGQGPIWLDDLDCNGTESSILNCSHKAFGVNNCGHNEDVAIQCMPGITLLLLLCLLLSLPSLSLSLSLSPSRKHTYIILTPLNPTCTWQNSGLQGYTLFSSFLLKTQTVGTR